MATANRGPRKHDIQLPKLGSVAVYAGVKVGDALEELMSDMTLYKGVRLSQVLEAVYEQGRKDGRAEVFGALEEVRRRKDLAHQNPGRPRKARTRGSAK